jgi:hypothetical protein
VRGDGGLVLWTGDPGYSLSAIVLMMGAAGLGDAQPDDTARWLVRTAFDPADGGMRDTAKADSRKFSNIAGLSLIALLGAKPF